MHLVFNHCWPKKIFIIFLFFFFQFCEHFHTGREYGPVFCHLGSVVVNTCSHVCFLELSAYHPSSLCLFVWGGYLKVIPTLSQRFL